jgi:hypothetical protein
MDNPELCLKDGAMILKMGFVLQAIVLKAVSQVILKKETAFRACKTTSL